MECLLPKLIKYARWKIEPDQKIPSDQNVIAPVNGLIFKTREGSASCNAH